MLDRTKTRVVEERNSRKDPMSDAEAQKLLGAVERVIIAKGKAARTVKASEAALDDLRGPTGNFRAPIIRRGKTLLVGFSDEELKRLVS